MYISKLKDLNSFPAVMHGKKINTNERKPTASHSAYTVNYIKKGYLHKKKLSFEKPS